MEATYWMLHKNDTERLKPMKDELTRLKNELEQMELNLVTSKITPELYEKFSGAHRLKIQEIQEGLGNLSQDSSNLDNMLTNATKLSSNLLNLWQMCDYSSKVRLQKIIFPEGLRYNRENHALRTPKINPILSAITSISISNGISKVDFAIPDEENLRQLYLMFASSNFFWENLEKTANVVAELEKNARLISGTVSTVTMDVPCYNEQSTTKRDQNDQISPLFSNMNFSLSGSTSDKTDRWWC